MTTARTSPLWRAAALAVLLAVGLAAPHLRGHDEAHAAGGEPAVAAAAADAGAERPAPCALCLAASAARHPLARVAVLPLPLAGAALPIFSRVAGPGPRDALADPAAPRAPPLG